MATRINSLQDTAALADTDYIAVDQPAQTGRLTLGDLRDQMGGSISVKQFGAVGDGVTDDTVAIQAMAASEGFVRFTDGTYSLSTTTILVPLIFEYGASITVASGQSVEIEHLIESPRQFIFKGDGGYFLQHNDDTGEPARQIHVSWFGAFPDPALGGSADQSAQIQKALDSVGNTREAVVDFDVGGYLIDSSSPILVGRGTWIRGSGIRRTVFSHPASNATTTSVFETIGDACKFSGFNFEVYSGSKIQHPWLVSKHKDTLVEQINLGYADYPIIHEDETHFRMWDCRVGYGTVSPDPINSAVVLIRGGYGHSIDRISVPTRSNDAPRSIIQIGDTSGSAVQGVTVSNLNYRCPSIGVLLYAASGSLEDINISNVNFFGDVTSPTNPAEAIVKTHTTGTHTISNVNVFGCTSSSTATALFEVLQDSTGSTKDITFSSSTISGSGGDGVVLNESSGTIERVSFSDSVNIKNRGTPLTVTGNPSFQFGAGVEPATLPTIVKDFSISDDGVVAIPLYRSVFTGFLRVSAQSSIYYSGVMRAAGSPARTDIDKSANVDSTVGVLTGTTGTDGNLTVSVDDGFIYVENRLGSTQRCAVVIETGISI